jgi:DNA-binding transcriptional ArsR family regulator
VGTRPVGLVFDALGDPGRRALVSSVAERGTATATELAAELPVTRQAVAKQLGALADAGLLRATRVGRETRYAVTPQPLEDAAEWLITVGAQWDERLAALGRSLARARASSSSVGVLQHGRTRGKPARPDDGVASGA